LTSGNVGGKGRADRSFQRRTEKRKKLASVGKRRGWQESRKKINGQRGGRRMVRRDQKNLERKRAKSYKSGQITCIAQKT